jgi:hypothetical protein
MIKYELSETATTTRFLDKNHELGVSERYHGVTATSFPSTVYRVSR